MKKKTISTQALEDVVNKSSADRIAISDLVEAMNAVGFGLVLMIFAFGITIPLPPPFPSVIAIPLVVFSLQMTIGYSSPRLPKKFVNLSVKRSVVAMLVQKSSPLIRRVERILRPRLLFVTSKIGEKIIGFFSLLFSAFIFLPIPLSNFIPGLGILIISFGLLGRDGLVVILGILVGIAGIAISVSTLFLGVEVLHHLGSWLGF